MKKRKLLIILLLCFSGYILFCFNNGKLSNNVIKPSEYIFKDTGDEILSSLYELSKYDERIIDIIKNKDKYRSELLEKLSKDIDLLDYVLGYEKNVGKVKYGNIPNIKKGIFPKLYQFDERWGYGFYGDDVLAINGCGPTSVAIVVAGLTGRNDLTPYKIALDAYKNGFYYGGTSWSFFTNGTKDYGVIGYEIPLSESVIKNELNQGHPIIMSMKPGIFTSTGHFIVVVGLKNGKFIVHDPNSKERSNTIYSYNEIKSQIKNLWAFKEIV